jgi:hypothetical protein
MFFYKWSYILRIAITHTSFPVSRKVYSQQPYLDDTKARPCIYLLYVIKPVTVAERCKACTFFAHSEAGIVGSNPKQGMDVWCFCVRECVFLCLCGGRGLATS